MAVKPTTSVITDGQREQISALVDDAIERALVGIDKDRAQQLIGSGGKFRGDLIALVRKYAATSEYAYEEEASDAVYPAAYRLRRITEQRKRLQEIFPQSLFDSIDNGAGTYPLPTEAEGYFVIPRWQSLAATYSEAVELVLTKLKEVYGGRFYHHRTGEIVANRLRERPDKASFFKRLAEDQGNKNLLVIPAQFGLLHRGRSMRRARVAVKANEVCLGAFEIGIMLLTHPDRLVEYGDLWVFCSGDEYVELDGDSSQRAPYFGAAGGRYVQFDAIRTVHRGGAGTGTVFFPSTWKEAA